MSNIIQDHEMRIKALENTLLSLSLSNIEGFEIEETTHSTANTQRIIPHALGQEPKGIVILYGDVYVKDYDESQIDVRSTQSKQKFKIKLLK